VLWKGAVTGADGAGNGPAGTSTGAHTVSDLLALDVRDRDDATMGTLNYGSLAVGGTTEKISNVTYVANAGNKAIYASLSGTDMCRTWTTPYTVCGDNTIGVGQQKWAAAYNTDYDSGTSLTGSDACINDDILPRSIITDPLGSKLIYFGIELPAGLPTGTYTGQNTFSASASCP
jgi:hypothetical protein